jgi:hypothetical protein
MAWVVLIFLLVVFSIILAGLLYAAFTGKGEPWIKIGLVLFDGLVGTCIVRIVFFLFSNKAIKTE